MEESCSAGQYSQRAVAPEGEQKEKEEFSLFKRKLTYFSRARTFSSLQIFTFITKRPQLQETVHSKSNNMNV